MNISLLKKLHQQATEIYNSDFDWEEKYHFIFSESISRKVFQEIRLDYYDPDTSYEEDVKAFMRAFDEKMELIKNVSDYDD